MTNEQVLAEAVQAWVEQMLPGDWGVAERATFVALNSYREGGTVREACRQACAFVESWTHHPAHLMPDHKPSLRLIS